MSCMMLSPAHIATVAHGLSYLLNQSEMCQLSAADELRDALGACRYPHDFLYDDRRIYPVLYRHNEAAYEGRYKVEPDETDEVPAMPDNVPHLLHRLDYNKHCPTPTTNIAPAWRLPAGVCPTSCFRGQASTTTATTF